MKKFTLFDFVHDNSLQIGETSWIQDLPAADDDTEKLFKVNENVVVNWPVGDRKTEKHYVKVVHMSDDPQKLVEMMQKLLQTNAVSKVPCLRRSKRKIIEMIFSDSDDGNMTEDQGEQYSPNAFLCSESSSDDEEPMYHLSKLELCAKIRSMRRKLANTMRENARLRQSLVMLQVLPQAVTHFEELVGMADALLKGGVTTTSSSGVLSHPVWKTSNGSLSESFTALHSNSSSPVMMNVEGDPPPRKQFKIEKWQIALCNKSKPQKFINDLMQALYSHEYMATHSLTGAKSSSSKDRAAKPAMNQNEVQEIIGVTKQLFPNVDDALIRRMMGQKLNNCTKKQNSSKEHTLLAFENHSS
ncbi:BEN domain-containing protein 6 isoform X2 [Microcaecilia unicolor]|uniref:BEN domain-containing protein 6 isoform X2 n=1 Tax=Microcaecilia unicolor TaxID=1415580 RepID=A0A6P7XG84_9AMPH|nr:BEN domain-containing protein 6 isoform X2 [Microcaecilia unicolor]